MKPGTLARIAVVSTVAAAAYVRFMRPRVLNWQATEEEAHRGMPGDEIVPDASLQTTRAIRIRARPEHIWPWLVQMGPRPRAGAYTYDWIERLLGIDIENKDRILPEFQHLEPSEFMGIDDKGNGLLVREVQPERALVLQWKPADSTWAFGLYPENGDTRFLSRNRLRGKGPVFWLGMIAFMEWASLIMERKMLLGIKQRAETLAAEEGSQP